MICQAWGKNAGNSSSGFSCMACKLHVNPLSDLVLLCIWTIVPGCGVVLFGVLLLLFGFVH